MLEEAETNDLCVAVSFSLDKVATDELFLPSPLLDEVGASCKLCVKEVQVTDNRERTASVEVA